MNSPGFGAVQLGMAGAGTAMAEDSMAILRNPAAGAWLNSGSAFDLGFAFPLGSTQVSGVGESSTTGLMTLSKGRRDSIEGVFPIPTYARNWRLSNRVSLGWGVAAAGLKAFTESGSATLARGLPPLEADCNGSFGGGSPTRPLTDLTELCGDASSRLGVDLAQVLISGHFAYRAAPTLSLGIAPILAAQRMSVTGLGAFAEFSNSPEHTTDNGFDYAWGGGFRAGFLWQPVTGFGIGAAYQSRLWQTRFDLYEGTVVGGSFDLAPTLNIGTQFHFFPGHRLLLDYEHIDYSVIKPLAHSMHGQHFSDGCFVPRILARSLPSAPALPACLGGSDGPGFGWKSLNVYKLGYQARLGEQLSVRVGMSWGGNPAGSQQAFSQLFAPAITDKHVSLGISWRRKSGGHLDIALLHGLSNHLREKSILSNAELRLLDGEIVGFDVKADESDQVFESKMRVWQLHVSWSLFN